MKTGPPGILPSLAVATTPAAGACLGTGARRVDAPYRELTGSGAREMLGDSRDVPILDVRSAWPRRLGGAALVPLPELAGRIDELSGYMSLPVAVVGVYGEAGRHACELLSGSGFRFRYVVSVPEGAEGLFARVRGGMEPDERSREAP